MYLNFQYAYVPICSELVYISAVAPCLVYRRACGLGREGRHVRALREWTTSDKFAGCVAASAADCHTGDATIATPRRHCPPRQTIKPNSPTEGLTVDAPPSICGRWQAGSRAGEGGQAGLEGGVTTQDSHSPVAHLHSLRARRRQIRRTVRTIYSAVVETSPGGVTS